MSSIVFATCLEQPDYQPSDALAAEALRRRGVDVAPAPWNGPQAPFADADLVVVRSTWDYMKAPDAFRAWLQGVDPARTLNAPTMMLWNLSKRYLAHLSRAGAPLPPTVFVAPHAGDLARAIDGLGVEEAVVKRIESAGGIGLSRVRAGDAGDIAAAVEALAGAAGMVQPLLPAIRTAGETSFVFIDGVFSHAVVKRPPAGEILCQEEHGGVTAPAAPSSAAIDEAARILSLCHAPDGPPLYARVDAIVEGPPLDERLTLMEVELIEPELFFGRAPAAADAFAGAVVNKLRN